MKRTSREHLAFVLLFVSSALAATDGQEQSPWAIQRRDFAVDSALIDSVYSLVAALQRSAVQDKAPGKVRAQPTQAATGAVSLESWQGHKTMQLSVGEVGMTYDVQKRCVRTYWDRSAPAQPDPFRGYLSHSDSIISKYRRFTRSEARAIAHSFLQKVAGKSVADELEVARVAHEPDGYAFEYLTSPAVAGAFSDGRYASLVVCPVSGKVVSYSGDLYPWTKPDYNPKIDHQRANTILRSFIKDSSLTVTGILGGRLHKKKLRGNDRWVWQFFVGEPNQRMNRTVWIDAETGEILRTL